jgi:hypothetical protein
MAFKLIESTHARWRAVNAPHLVALVRAGVSHRSASRAGPPPDRRGYAFVLQGCAHDSAVLIIIHRHTVNRLGSSVDEHTDYGEGGNVCGADPCRLRPAAKTNVSAARAGTGSGTSGERR